MSKEEKTFDLENRLIDFAVDINFCVKHKKQQTKINKKNHKRYFSFLYNKAE